MNPTMLSKEESPLLDNAISKLQPEVFSHPIWMRFGEKEAAVSPKTIKALNVEADNLKQNNPSDACQVLLICAVFQHHAGQAGNALVTIQEIQDLAKKAKLDKEVLWALWGGCAICVQHKSFEQAAAYLSSLKSRLSDQNDWVLAGFVDVVKQTLMQRANTKEASPVKFPKKQTTRDLLTPTFRWLYQWGSSVQPQELTGPLSGTQDSFLYHITPLSKGWRSLRLFFRGELKVDWQDNGSGRGKRRPSFWGTILSWLHIEVMSPGQENEAKSIKGDIAPIEIVEVQTPVDVTPVIFHEEVEPVQAEPLLISVQTLGNFNLSIDETPLNLSSSRSLSLLKYLLLHHKQHTPREMLIDLFWPDVSMEKGRNNLNVAMNGIRTSLRTVTDTPVILYKDNAYGMAQDLQIWVDVEEFEQLVDSGKRLEARNKLSSAISDYEAAVSLYQGDFLEENPYENWTVLPRERLRLAYLTTLDRLSRIYYTQEKYAMCITFSQLILARDRCREDAHSILMRCYSRQGQDHLALRQYQVCVEALRMELDVTPTPETTRLYEQIRLHRQV